MNRTDEFWSKVDRKDVSSCWPWTAATSGTGYGNFVFEGRQQGTHRIAWQLHNGAPLGDRVACHTCDNRACCNPHHIYAGSQRDNVQDALRRGRMKEMFQGGEGHPNAKLTDQEVMEIKMLVGSGPSQREIGEMYGVTQSAVSMVARGVRRGG